LYEDHFYLKNITDVHAFEGITSDTCVMSYHLMGNTPGLSPKEYETRHSGSDVRSETMDNNVKVALCKVRGVPRASPMKKLSIPAVAIPAVTVAIPTYNRIGYVQLTSSAFQSTFPAEDTWIFDDKSSEYGTHDLIGWYGTEHVWQSKKRLKADAMARHILEWFLSTKYDVLVLLDSDLIVAPDWHAELRTGLRESTGLLSLYRSGAPKHKSVSCGDVLCQQPSMGNAGTVWRRDLAKRMLAEMSARDGGFDWGWSEWCTKNKVPMEALKKSAVLHIGMYGSWSHESTAEKSVGFPMGELSTEVRERAEMYLKGGKPKRMEKKKRSTNIQAIHVNGGTDRIKCDIPCFWPIGGGPVLREFHIDELKTTLSMSMEGEEYYPSLKLSNRKKNHAIASTRFDSDIPMPYYNWPWTLYMDKTPQEKDKWSRNYIQSPHIKFSKVKKTAVFIARNCGSRSNREGLVKSLMNLMPVDSVSSCLHNFDLPDRSEKLPMMQKYAMYFAFENQRIDDYITEKLWDTFRAGVLPIYFGAPNIKEHVPEHSIVHVDDFASHEELAQHLKDIMSNKELYNSYHAWRYKPLPNWFVHKYNFTHVHSACRTCRWASAKLRGLPWDAARQQIATVAPVAAIACDEELEEYSLSKGCSTSAKHCLVETSIPCCQNIVFHTLEKIVAVLDNNNIKYSLMYGTLIAAARDQFLQPFDNRDVDIAIPSSQLSTLLRLLDLEPFRTGSVTSFRDEEYKKETRAIVGKYCVHNGEQGWDPSYQHNYSLFRHPPYVDVYSRPDAEFQEVSKLQLGTQSLPPKEWMVFQNWKSRLDSVYPKWQTRPDWISPAQYGYHGLPGDSEDILWVIPAFKRAWSLDLVLKSLASQTKILVSKDADSAEIDSVLKKYPVDVIEHPSSCSRHPNRFPAKDDSLNENYKGDTYGNPRSPWATCLKHHWWWMMKQAWAKGPERVCVLEDDTVIHPQAFDWLVKQTGNVKLTPEEIAVPWCMSAKEWQTIEPKAFCEHDDYNWDQTIAWMKEHAHQNEAVVPSVSLSMHVGDCGGWDAGGRDKTCTPEKVAAIRTHVNQWMAKSVSATYTKKQWLTSHKQKNGGWAHPKDHEHCLEVAGKASKSTSKTYAIVMPSVKRNNNKYLQQALESLEATKPADVPVLLVNGNQPVEAHTFLAEWCAHHTQYECIEPPPVSESLIQDAIRLDKRGDTAHFLRWRTMGNMHALFGLKKALTKNTKYIIWIEDDVIVPKTFFDALEPGEVICLRDGKEWCGSTAYLFSRHFVEHLIQDIDAQKLTMPIDWIIFDPNLPEAKYHVPKRIPLATHIGKKSSKHLSKKNSQYIQTRTLNPYNMVLHEPPGIVSVELQKTGVWETGITNRFESVFATKCLNKNFIDVGTNIGYYSLLAASFGHSVLSIEAMDYNLNVYRKSVAINDFDNIVIEHAGVSDSSGGYLCMEMPEGNAGNGVATFSSTKCKNSVKVKTIDEITAGIYENTFAMKLDIEGFETRALLGAEKFIERVKPCYIWFEYVKEAVIRSGKNPNDIFIFLESLGYIIYDLATPEKPVHSILSAAFLEARHESCPYSYVCHDALPLSVKNRWVTIQTADLFAAIDYNAPENKGPWKQGWDYDYDGRFKDGLTVHVVPHSHNDPGWIKTYHTYYSTQTRHILDTVVAALTEDPRRTFIWAEISYFSLWWDDASQHQKEQAKRLVAEKRLDFVTGGWVMNDEASVTARATRWHLQEGRDWLKETFGITPQYSWAIDPFGHSAGQAQVLKEMGYKGMLIQRVHYAVKKQLAQKQQLEFQWSTPAGDIFTHMMPFYSYDGPHTCGPDPSVCCQFDFARINGGYSGCPWHKTAVPITTANVAERSKLWLGQVYKKAMLYKGKDVLIPIGDDFRYQTMDEAHKQFENYQKMFDWIGVHLPSVKVSFSTLTRYFDSVRYTPVQRLQGSFFPYSDRVQDYWTGYFNSRIFYKGYDRLLESFIAAVESKCPTVDIHLQKRALGIFQHHDGITGTAKSAVVQDYYQTMQKAVTELKSKLKTCLDITGYVLVNPLSVDTPTMKADEIRPYEEDTCVSVPAAGLHFENIKIDKHGNILQINDTPVHESLVWRSNKPGQGVAGAYLMSVTSKEDILQPIKHTTCIAKMYKQLETTFDMLKRRIRVYNDGTIEFIYDVDIHARNNGELWAVYKPEWLAERLCSDVHGLTWECHIERKDAPLQAKFWPMPTMAWLASSTDRMTFTGAQPTGVGFHEGAMVLMLDRRGNQDDARGLGQGITDSRPVEMRFGVLMEGEHLKERASEKALLIRNWMLNPAIEIV
jgi:alpha-mannosidase II